MAVRCLCEPSQHAVEPVFAFSLFRLYALLVDLMSSMLYVLVFRTADIVNIASDGVLAVMPQVHCEVRG